MNRERCVTRKLALEQMMNINGTPLLDFQQQTLWTFATLGFDGRSALQTVLDPNCSEIFTLLSSFTTKITF